jgi:hypothetical protein
MRHRTGERTIYVNHDGNGSAPRRRRLRGTHQLSAWINGGLAGIGNVYVITQSIPITMIASVVALLAGLIIVKR